MSRPYFITITVRASLQSNLKEVVEACRRCWPILEKDIVFEFVDGVEELFAQGQGQLCGGKTEEELADRISAEIWKAYGRYCFVMVEAEPLENPSRAYEKGPDEYNEWLKKTDDSKETENE